jgi:zona occludens toxin
MGDEMIYLVTGAPGSGKTLYAVAKLIPEVLKAVPSEAGQPGQARRLCVDGIPDLVLPHEEMAKPARDALTGEYKGGEGFGVWNWHEWVKAGDLLVIDEVQRHWRPRGMGTKPPPEIAALETHRHRGIDFIIITQHPMLIDQNVRRLIGRHEHVRRLFGMKRALVYQWDGCQSDVSRLGSGTRTIFSYPKKAMQLYKSSELHTKQQYKIPAFFAFPLVVAGLAIVAGPSAYSALKGAATGKGISSEKASARAIPNAEPTAGKAGGDSAPGAAAPALPAVGESKAQTLKVAVGSEFAGCIAMGARCSCFDMGGRLVETEAETCRKAVETVARVTISDGAIAVAPSVPVTDQSGEASDVPRETGAGKGPGSTTAAGAGNQTKAANIQGRLDPGGRHGEARVVSPRFEPIGVKS